MCLLPLTGPLLSRVWGEATDCAQAVLEKEEMQVKILSKSFQDSVNRPPPQNSFSSPPHVESEARATVLGEKGTVSITSPFFCNLASLLYLQEPLCE